MRKEREVSLKKKTPTTIVGEKEVPLLSIQRLIFRVQFDVQLLSTQRLIFRESEDGKFRGEALGESKQDCGAAKPTNTATQ